MDTTWRWCCCYAATIVTACNSIMTSCALIMYCDHSISQPPVHLCFAQAIELLHTLKSPLFFHFHGDFHRKWLFAHPKISFAHPELPFLAKSMIVTSVAVRYKKSISIIETVISIDYRYIDFLASYFSDRSRGLDRMGDNWRTVNTSANPHISDQLRTEYAC